MISSMKEYPAANTNPARNGASPARSFNKAISLRSFVRESRRLWANFYSAMKLIDCATAVLVCFFFAGCVAVTEQPAPRQERSQAQNVRVDPKQAERLYRIMTPLLASMNNPKQPREVQIGIVEQREINAANAGGGRFYITTGLLGQANDDQLRGIMAHEIAHDDLGHVAKLQMLGAGLNLGVVLLEQLIPGSSAVTPIAGTLIARGYSRSEELSADRHGVEILRRAGYSKQVMVNALNWVAQTSGSSGGGFLSTHPATGERIDALRRLS
jgi:predicted Zn-dependent protease